MNIISILAILMTSLVATAVFETILRVVLRKRYRFTARRFGIGLLASCGVVFLLITAGGIIHPTRTVASRNTLSYIKSHYPHTQLSLRRTEQVRLSDKEGFFLFKCKLPSKNIFLKTTYKTSEDKTVFLTTETKPMNNESNNRLQTIGDTSPQPDP